jgi:Tfp pilus assembly PilM family ATPase
MIISGGCANIDNIKDLLSEQFEIPVIIGNPLEGIKIDERAFDIERIKKLKDPLATVLGLAMRER